MPGFVLDAENKHPDTFLVFMEFLAKIEKQILLITIQCEEGVLKMVTKHKPDTSKEQNNFGEWGTLTPNPGVPSLLGSEQVQHLASFSLYSHFVVTRLSSLLLSALPHSKHLIDEIREEEPDTQNLTLGGLLPLGSLCFPLEGLWLQPCPRLGGASV